MSISLEQAFKQLEQSERLRRQNLQDESTFSLYERPVARPRTVEFVWTADKNKPKRKRRIIGIKAGSIIYINNVDIWVNSETTDMLMDRYFGRSISGTIRYGGLVRTRGGDRDAIAVELKEQLNGKLFVEPGTVLITTAGELYKKNGVRRIMHVATVEGNATDGLFAKYHIISDCVSNVLEEAEALNRGLRRIPGFNLLRRPYRSIVIPLLGTGKANASKQDVIERIVPRVIRFFENYPRARLREIYLIVHREEDVPLLETALRKQDKLIPPEPSTRSITRQVEPRVADIMLTKLVQTYEVPDEVHAGAYAVGDAHSVQESGQVSPPDGNLGAARSKLQQAQATDGVDCSVFAPRKVPRRAACSIQVFLHLREDLIKAARMALEQDRTSNRIRFGVLETRIGQGASVELYLDSKEILIREPIQMIVWEGRPVRAIFAAEVPDVSGIARAVVTVGVNGIPIGEIEFEIEVVEHSLQAATLFEDAGLPQALTHETRGAVVQAAANIAVAGAGTEPATTVEDSDPVGTSSTRFSRAFISYSRRDFQTVSWFAQGLAQQSAELFFDVVELEPGDEWATEIKRQIDQADVFFLMWSTNAATSTEVDKETRYAVAMYNESGRKRPRIKPIPLHLPWPPPPDYLSGFHFYSEWQAHRVAHEVGLVADSAQSVRE